MVSRPAPSPPPPPPLPTSSPVPLSSPMISSPAPNDLDQCPSGRKSLAQIRCQDFHSACSFDSIRIVEVMLPILKKDLVVMTEKAAQNDALKAKVDALQGQLDKITLEVQDLEEEKKALALLKERMASTEAEHNNTKAQCEALKSQVKEISLLRSKIGSLEQEKNALQVENNAQKIHCQTLQSQVEEIPGLKSQVKALGEVGTALRCEKAGLEAELKSAISELEKCQIVVKSLIERIQTLEEREVAWLGSEERLKAAITAFKVEQDKMIQDKCAQDSEIKTFHAELKELKNQVESYKSQLKAVVHNEGSCSRSLGKLSSERPSNQAQFDSISQQQNMAEINFATPTPSLSPATRITQAKGGSDMRYNARSIMRVVPLLSEAAVLRITELGFGNFLDISFLDLICRDMIRWLATKFVVKEHNGKECVVLNVDPTSPRFITPEVVNIIYGAPLGPDLKLRPLPRNTMHDETLRMSLGVEKNENITPYHLESAINYAKEIGDVEFEVKCFFLLLFNKMLLPSTSYYIVPKHMQLVQDIKRIGRINWCQEIWENVKSGLLKFHESGGYIPNPAVMLIFFMGNVDCEDIMAGEEFKVPQIKYYSQEMVKKISNLDYKNLKLKPWNSTVYGQYMRVDANECVDQCETRKINVKAKRVRGMLRQKSKIFMTKKRHAQM